MLHSSSLMAKKEARPGPGLSPAQAGGGGLAGEKGKADLGPSLGSEQAPFLAMWHEACMDQKRIVNHQFID